MQFAIVKRQEINTMSLKRIKFSNTSDQEFVHTLRKRVKNYFDDNNISRYANYKMVIKTVVMILGYITPYFLIVFGGFTNLWLLLGLWILMGLGKAGIGLSIMHDANHGAYSKNKRVNTVLGYLMSALGSNTANWRIQHNVLHHTYTNVDGFDEDIDTGKILRFSPNQPLIKIHRFQYIYAWALYSLMTIMRTTVKDFQQLKGFKEKGLTDLEGGYKKMLRELIISKALYIGIVVVIPCIVVNAPVWFTIMCFFLMHMVTGVILALIFQTAHISPDTIFPLPEKDGSLANNWAVHQLKTTCNYAPKNKILSWYVGGLNYQIEHHLFPNICHVHYKEISKIVEETAKEYGLPYFSYRTFRGAIAKHGQMLYQLGRA